MELKQIDQAQNNLNKDKPMEKVTENYSYKNNEFLLSFVEAWTVIVEAYNYNQNKDGKGKKAKKYRPFEPPILKKLKELSIMTGIGEVDLQSKYKLAKKYRNLIIKNNEKLVQSILNEFMKKHSCYHMEQSLYNSGLIGLANSIDGYRQKYNVKFATYAYTGIIREIKHNYYQENTLIYIPKESQENLKKRKRITEHEKTQILQAKRIVSLSSPVAKEEDSIKIEETKLTSIFDEYSQESGYSKPEELIHEIERQELLNELLNCLSESEIEMIEAIYGLNQTAISLSEYGREKGLIRQTVKARLNKALKKLKAQANKIGLKFDDFL